MFYQTSFNNQAEDYLQTLVQDRIRNVYNDQSPQYNRDQIQTEFTPFMKRHSSSGDSYVHNQPHYPNAGTMSSHDYQHEHQVSMDMDGSQTFTKTFYQPHFEQQNKPNNQLEDSFLQMVDKHLSNIQQEQQNLNNLNEQKSSQLLNPHCQTISLSKQQICHALLQNQSVMDSIQLTNLLPVSSIVRITNSPFQFRLMNTKTKSMKREEVQISLEPYETVDIEFQIRRRQSEIGNIYETLKIQTYSASNENKAHLQKKYLKFQITFVKPKLEVTFLGKTSVKRIQQHKIAHLQIYPNEINEYFINLIFSQDQFSAMNSSKLKKIECQISAKGYLSVHPSSIILYRDEPLKIILRKLTQVSGIAKNSAIVIKPLDSSLVYVIAVKCMDKKIDNNGQQDFVKMNKFTF